MRNLSFAKNLNRGFSLAETVIVLAISTIIIGVIFSIILYSKQSFSIGENVAEIIQNGRVVIERISREVRQAKKIVTSLPEEDINPSSEIKFQDGHLSEISESGQAQGSSINTIVLSLSSQRAVD